VKFLGAVSAQKPEAIRDNAGLMLIIARTVVGLKYLGKLP
jgi:hypothetical protein